MGLTSALNSNLLVLLQNSFQLSVPDSTCRWITDFLFVRRQHVKLGKHVSDSRTISTGSPQGCDRLCFSLYTNSCISTQSVKPLKFGLTWCSWNNLGLITLKTVEMAVDF